MLFVLVVLLSTLPCGAIRFAIAPYEYLSADFTDYEWLLAVSGPT